MHGSPRNPAHFPGKQRGQPPAGFPQVLEKPLEPPVQEIVVVTGLEKLDIRIFQQEPQIGIIAFFNEESVVVVQDDEVLLGVGKSVLECQVRLLPAERFLFPEDQAGQGREFP